MDKIGADFFQCLSDIVDRLGAKPVAIQLPIGAENQFKGIIDLVRMVGVTWEDEALGAKYHDIEIPADVLDQAKEYREKLVEAAVELDDDAMAAYLDGQEPDEATLKRLLRKAVITGAFYPVLCGSAFKNKGVQPLLDAVVDFLPSPLDVPAIKGVDDKGNEIERQSGRLLSRCRSWRSRSWMIRSSAPSRSAGSIRDARRAAPGSSIRPRTARNASAACC